MANTDYRSVEDYLDAQPETVRPVLQRVRQAMRKALPGAEEVISYQIPAFKVDGRVAIYFAGWKEHYSVYPASKALVAAFAGQLDGCVVQGSTLRFPLTNPVPVALIGRIAKFRVAEVAEVFAARAAAKAAKKRANAGGR
jgi:uncharacterized protein YdhG (YjbR/CyaY superfamily)